MKTTEQIALAKAVHNDVCELIITVEHACETVMAESYHDRPVALYDRLADLQDDLESHREALDEYIDELQAPFNPDLVANQLLDRKLWPEDVTLEGDQWCAVRDALRTLMNTRQESAMLPMLAAAIIDFIDEEILVDDPNE